MILTPKTTASITPDTPSDVRAVLKVAALLHQVSSCPLLVHACMQNADMVFERCFVPDSARLPGVNSFKDTNKVLAISRYVHVCINNITPSALARNVVCIAVKIRNPGWTL